MKWIIILVVAIVALLLMLVCRVVSEFEKANEDYDELYSEYLINKDDEDKE